jgi:hypothetical protein
VSATYKSQASVEEYWIFNEKVSSRYFKVHCIGKCQRYMPKEIFPKKRSVFLLHILLASLLKPQIAINGAIIKEEMYCSKNMGVSENFSQFNLKIM